MSTAPAQDVSSALQAVQARRLLRIEKTFVVIALLWLMTTFGGLLASRTGDREGGNVVLEVVNLAIYCLGLLFMLRSPARTLPGLLLRAWPLLILLAFAMVSISWSDSPSVSFRRWSGLILTTSLAFYIVGSYSLDEFLKLLLIAVGAYVAIGIVAAAVPGQGITPDGIWAGAWRGFTGMKNIFGRFLALGFAFFVVFGLAGLPWWRRVWIVGALATLVLTLLSKSKTSLVVSFGAVFFAIVIRVLSQGRLGRLRLGPDVRIVIALGILGALVGVIVLLPILLEALGRDITLSGRVKLWNWAIDLNLAYGHPWIGHGYRAFWIDANTKYFFEFFGWMASIDGERSNSFAGPANGHNGYLDVWLELGWVGIGLLAVLFGSIFGRARAAFAQFDLPAGYALATVGSFVLVYSVPERIILQQSEGVWFLLTLTYLYADSRLLRADGHFFGTPIDRSRPESA